MIAVTISSLHVYPVKSCRGHAVERATLDACGFTGDRRFLIIEESGRFITQRETPALARITPVVHDGHLTLTRAGAAPLTLSTAPADARVREVVIWSDTVRAIDLGDDVAHWLHEALGRPARLVGMGREFTRPMTKTLAHPDDEVAFADAHPLLLIGESSLDALNARLDFPVPMNRFRPNLVLQGAPAHAEDAWRRIRIGSVILRASGPCARCVITTTDQDTLTRGKEPLRTLATFRRDANGDVNFGQNYIHETKTGTLGVGDVVEILE